MAAVPQRGTTPERKTKALLAALGYRTSDNTRKKLPGRPDIVLSARRKVIFVHGCFWHAHLNCPKATLPKTRRSYWSQKFQDNRRRDARVRSALTRQGWKSLVVWECQLRNPSLVVKRLTKFLSAER